MLYHIRDARLKGLQLYKLYCCRTINETSSEEEEVEARNPLGVIAVGNKGNEGNQGNAEILRTRSPTTMTTWLTRLSNPTN